MQECSLFSTPSPAFIVCRFFDDGHSDWCVVVPHLWFSFAFHWWLVMLSMFSCVYWPFILWWSAYVFCPFLTWVVFLMIIELWRVVYKFCMQVFCQIHALWRFSPDWENFLLPLHSLFLFKIYLFIYLLAASGLRCCTRAFSSCGEWELLFVVEHGL